MSPRTNLKKISNEIDMNYKCPQCFQSALPLHSVTDCEWNDLFSPKPSLSAASLNDLFSEMNIQNSWPSIVDLQDELIENNMLNDAYITAEEAKLLLTPKSSCENDCSFATLCLNARSLVNPIRWLNQTTSVNTSTYLTADQNTKVVEWPFILKMD